MGVRNGVCVVVAGTAAGIGPGAWAQSIVYESVVQEVSGSAAVSELFGGDDSDSFAFLDLTPTANDESFGIDAVVGPGEIVVNGSLVSSFGADGFSISASAQGVVTDPGAFAGTFLTGNFAITALGQVRFSVAEPTEVAWTLSTQTYGGFFREDQFEVFALFDFGTPGGSASGTQVLMPGTYVFDGGINLEFDDADGSLGAGAVTDIHFSLAVIPGPGAGVAGAGVLVLASRRRRMAR